ncbi:MAG: phage tail tape measure protein [Pleomorphochaeta sp.]
MKLFTSSVKLVFEDQFSNAAKRAKTSVEGIGEAMNKLQAGDSMLQTASQLGLIAATTEQYRNKITAALEVPTAQAASLEDAMQKANTVLTADISIDGDIEKTYAALKNQALEWAQGTATGSKIATASAAEYADTSYSMLSAGLKADAAIAATNKSIVLAKGTMGSTSAAADLLATAYNTMGDKSVDANQEIGMLSDTVAKTQATFQIANLGQLNEGLKYGIPAAQKYGLAWSELNTIIGQLNTSGLTGSLAGTSFNSMMAQMQKASKSLGFKVAYNDEGGIQVIETLKNIRSQFGDLKNLTPEMQMAFDQAFGTEGGRGLTLLSSSLDSLEANFVAVSNSEGQAEEMASKINSTYSSKLTQLENAQAAMQARLGESTISLKSKFIDLKLGWTNAASSILSTDIGQKLAVIVSGSSMAASGLLQVGGTALNVGAQVATIAAMSSKAGGMLSLLKSTASLISVPFSFFGGVLGHVGKNLLGVGKAVIGIIPKMGAWIASAWSAAAAHWAMLGPILLVVAAIAAVAVGTVLLIKNWTKVKTFFTNLWSGIKDGAVASFDFIVSKVEAVKDKITAPFQKVGKFIGNIFGKKEGEAQVETMAEGIYSSNSLEAATVKTVNNVSEYMPHSDAKKGPLSKLTLSGKAIPETMAIGVKSSNTVLSKETKNAFNGIDLNNIVDFNQYKTSQSINNLSANSSAKTSKIEKHYHVNINSVNLPNVDDLEGVVEFVQSLEEEFNKEEEAM